METQPSRKFIDLNKVEKVKLSLEPLKHKMKFARAIAVPEFGSVKSLVDKVYDQGNLGSCVANSFCSSYKIASSHKFDPSRLFTYYGARSLEGEELTDSGCNPIDALNFAYDRGVCSDVLYPYIESKVNDVPSEQCFTEALAHKIGHYSIFNIGDLNSIKYAITRGIPVMIGIAVYESFMNTGSDGLVKIPNPTKYDNYNDTKDAFLGGHMITIVGYYDKPKLFTVLNSWGSGWAKQGYCYLPYSYVADKNLTFVACSIEKF